VRPGSYAAPWALRAVIAAAALQLAIACDRPGQRSEGGDDPGLRAVQRLALADSPRVSIGGRDEREEYQLGYVVGALRLSDGRIVVADGQPRLLRYYDPAGRHLRAVGGEGNGPGEFERVSAITRLRADTIVAWDALQRRLTRFSSAGETASTLNLPPLTTVTGDVQARNPRHFVFLMTLHPLEGGRLMAEFMAEPNMEAISASQLIQDTMPLIALDPAGGQRVELGPFPGIEFFFHGGSGRGLAFGETVRVAAGGDRVYAASTRSATILAYSPWTGEVVDSIHLPTPRRAPSVEDREAVRRRASGRVRPEQRARAEEYADAIPWPDSFPMFSELRVGADRRLWVQLYQAPTDASQNWLVFEPSGDLSASVTMDPALRLLDAGADYVVVLRTDELDVQEIRLHPLVALPEG
jgi:hypothetical protein